MQRNEQFDAIIIGGSYAGMAAAMSLGRAIRKVLVIDGGEPCNQQTPHSHNFLTQDGSTPAYITTIAKQQVLAYPTVRFLIGNVCSVWGNDGHFLVETTNGECFEAKKLLFATGIRDLMPMIKGFTDCWGISVIHCPYCHGYEYRGENTGLLMNGDMVLEKVKLISQWTKRVTVFTNGLVEIPSEHVEILTNLGVQIWDNVIDYLIHDKGYISKVVFTDGQEIPLTTLYAALPFEQKSELPQNLGCSLRDSGHLQVDQFQQTTVSGVFAAGDNATFMRSVASAVHAGTSAGAFINHALLSE